MTDEFESARAPLVARIARLTAGREHVVTAIPGLSLYRHARAGAPVSCLLEPAIALPVQGIKQALIGANTYRYDVHRCLITSIDLPAVLQVARGSRSSPYLSAVLRLDASVMGELILLGKLPPPRGLARSSCGAMLQDTTHSLLTAFDRLVALLDEPGLIPVLAPLIQREIFYRLLHGASGWQLWQMAAAGSQGQRISRAIDWLKGNFREVLRVEELAAQVDMSPSRFHHHFRQLTSRSPLQFQKWLRLEEARRLMVTQGLEASSAAFDVGYASASQFSREYARLFGTPPRRDVDELLRLPPA